MLIHNRLKPYDGLVQNRINMLIQPRLAMEFLTDGCRGSDLDEIRRLVEEFYRVEPLGILQLILGLKMTVSGAALI